MKWIKRFMKMFSENENKDEQRTEIEPDILWWLVKGQIAGMGKPLDEEYRLLKDMGFGAVVSLLEEPPPMDLYEKNSFLHLWLPVKDGQPPSEEQAKSFALFADSSIECRKKVVVHCMAGWGRTGTLLASYLIWKGAKPEDAILTTRKSQPHAIQTELQEHFLLQLRVRS